MGKLRAVYDLAPALLPRLSHRGTRNQQGRRGTQLGQSARRGRCTSLGGTRWAQARPRGSLRSTRAGSGRGGSVGRQEGKLLRPLRTVADGAGVRNGVARVADLGKRRGRSGQSASQAKERLLASAELSPRPPGTGDTMRPPTRQASRAPSRSGTPSERLRRQGSSCPSGTGPRGQRVRAGSQSPSGASVTTRGCGTSGRLRRAQRRRRLGTTSPRGRACSHRARRCSTCWR